MITRSIYSLPTLNYAIHYYIIPIYAIPTPNSLLIIIVLTLDLFGIVLPYMYGITEVLCGSLYFETEFPVVCARGNKKHHHVGSMTTFSQTSLAA